MEERLHIEVRTASELSIKQSPWITADPTRILSNGIVATGQSISFIEGKRVRESFLSNKTKGHPVSGPQNESLARHGLGETRTTNSDGEERGNFEGKAERTCAPDVTGKIPPSALPTL